MTHICPDSAGFPANARARQQRRHRYETDLYTRTGADAGRLERGFAPAEQRKKRRVPGSPGNGVCRAGHLYRPVQRLRPLLQPHRGASVALRSVPGRRAGSPLRRGTPGTSRPPGVHRASVQDAETSAAGAEPSVSLHAPVCVSADGLFKRPVHPAVQKYGRAGLQRVALPHFLPGAGAVRKPRPCQQTGLPRVVAAAGPCGTVHRGRSEA